MADDPEIVYDKSVKTGGRFEEEGSIHSFLSKLLPSIFKPGGTIYVNPNNTANVPTTIQHEKIHALLNTMGNSGQLQKFNDANPFYKQVAAKIGLEPNGSTNIEAPAYTATGEASQFGVPPVLSQQYNDYLRKQLFQLDPGLAGQFQKLSTPSTDTSIVPGTPVQ
jgi:hypothetical protein